MSAVSSEPNKHSLGKAIGWSIAFMLLGMSVSAGLIVPVGLVVPGDVARGVGTLANPGPTQTIVAGVSQLLGFGFATWFVGFRILRLGRAQLRWAPARIGARGMAIGLALGAAAAAVALVSAVLLAHSHWSRDAGGVGDYLSQVLKTSLVLAPAALSEEIMFRGIPLVLLAAAIGRGSALVLVAGLIFALFHGLNPGLLRSASATLRSRAFFSGVAFYAPGGLWTAFGAHLGWNASLAALDAPGERSPVQHPIHRLSRR